MSETKIKLEELYQHLLKLPRGQERSDNHFRIVIAILHLAWPQCPTRDQLQTLTRIRRARFIRVLRYLVDTGTVVKFGEGTNQSPFKYRLADGYQNP